MENNTENTAKSRKQEFKEYFSATRIAYIAVFTALSFVLRMWQFSVLPAVPYLQLDFSDAFVMICGYALGPVAGSVTLVVKELIYGIFFSSTLFVGEFANILITLPFMLFTSILYKKHKGIKWVLSGLSVACVLRIIWCVPVNYCINFPAFAGFNWEAGTGAFVKAWYWVVLFNAIKTFALAAVTFILYKPLSRLIKMTSDKLDNRKKA